MDYIKIFNPKQAAFYITRGVRCVDVYYTDKFIWVFRLDDTKAAWEEWKTGGVKVEGFRY